ncbi:MAG: DegT/DnrJ/EryC1/StrS family aminotransferase [Syntrophales bacterium]|nr:DegT/DnrJ/EryC1/StrS family aminotransferase [Syntrophales bacterium]
MIPMVDLQRQYQQLKPDIDAAVQDVLSQSQFILGLNVAALEKEIAAYHGRAFAIGVASGTDALLLALRACGICPGDEVITTPFTFIATAEVIALLQAVPVFVDIEPDTFNIDPEKIEQKITARTRAIIPVHLFGHPAAMTAVMGLAEKYKLKIIEDCAQAFGAEHHGKKVGAFGDCGCFSFFPSKNLAGYGDGGMIVTDDEQTAKKIRMLRNHGSSVRYHHSLIGYNSRLDEIQAAIIRVKFRYIDSFNASRRANARIYRTLLHKNGMALPTERLGCRHVYHQFTIRSARRDRIMAALQENGIASAVYYPVPLHRQEAFAGGDAAGDRLACAETCAGEVLSLPMFPELSQDEIRIICDVVNHVS